MEAQVVQRLLFTEFLDSLGVESIDDVMRQKAIKAQYIEPALFLRSNNGYYEFYQKANDTALNVPMSLKMGFGDIVNLWSNSDNALRRPTMSLLTKGFLSFMNPAFPSVFMEEKHRMQLRIRPSQVYTAGSKRNILLSVTRPSLMMRGLESNVIPFLDAVAFPYSAIILFSNGAQKGLLVHQDLCTALRLDVSGPRGQGSLQDFVQLTGSVEEIARIVTTAMGTTKGFATFIPDATSVQCAAHTHFCVAIEKDSSQVENDSGLTQAAVEALKNALGFVPAIYVGMPDGQQYRAPDFVYDDAKQQLVTFESIFAGVEELSMPSTAQENGQFKISSWNLQGTGTIMYDTAMMIPNPFVQHAAYKYPKMLSTIAKLNADVLCLSEASPILQIRQGVEALGYRMCTTQISTELPSLPCDTGVFQVNSAVLFKTAVFDLIGQQDVYMAKLGVDLRLLRQFGARVPALQAQRPFTYLNPFRTYNSATILALRHKQSGQTFQVAAVYPTWQPVLEPYKYLSFKYIEAMARQQAEALNLAPETGLVMAGDFNVRPTAPTYLMLTGHQMTPSQADTINQPFVDEFLAGQQTSTIKFADLFDAEQKLEFSHSFRSVYGTHQAGEGYKTRTVEIDGVQIEINEPAASTVTADFVECLDYIVCTPNFTVTAVDKLYQPQILCNAECVSDHVPTGAVLEFK